MPEATVEPERGAMDNTPVAWYSKKGLDNLLENRFVAGVCFNILYCFISNYTLD